MVSWFLLPLVALSVILSLTYAQALPGPAVVMGPYGNPLMFMRDKRTPIGIYPQRAMMFTSYHRPIRQPYNGDQATAVFTQGNSVNGAAYLDGSQQPYYLRPGLEPAIQPEIANSEAEAAPQPEENSSPEDEGHRNEVQGQGNEEHHKQPQGQTNEDSYPSTTISPEELTETDIAPQKKTGTKKGKKVIRPVPEEKEEENEEDDEYDDDITGEIYPVVPVKGKRRKQYPSRNTFFPMIFGYPGGSSRSGSPGSSPGSVTAIANSYSTGKGGVANSVATANGGSSQKKPKRPRAPNAED